MAFTVRIRQHPQAISVESGETILAAALRQGVAYPFGCQSGNCGSCKSHLFAGEVEMAPYSDYALEPAEKARGVILACRAVPWSDAEVAWLEDSERELHPVRQLSCRVAELAPMTHDIRRLRLGIEAGGPFAFSAGQFARLAFPGQPPRDYSMANRPKDQGEETLLEFHIRRVAGGRASAFAVERLRLGDAVAVEGPFGSSYLRAGHEGPLLALAGGSGLAPIKSIVETALGRARARPIWLYFGVRDERDLYLEAHFTALARQHPGLRFVPVLSEPSAPTARRRGMLHEAVAADHAGFAGFKAYLAGPPPMVEAASAMLRARGLPPEDIHADAFYTEAEKAALAAPA